MIDVKNLSYSYDGKNKVLEDVNFSVSDGQIMGLVGINGAGKSTLLRILSGVYNSYDGDIKIDDFVPNDIKYRQNLFFLSDDPFYTSDTTCLELKKLYKVFFKDFDDKLFDELMKNFNLPVKKKLKSFSKGMRRQTYIAISFAASPKYIFYDEAFDGLDPLAKIRFKDNIKKLAKEKGSTVIISSHSLAELSDFCDEYIMIDGKHITHAGKDEAKTDSEYCKFQVSFEKVMEQEAFSGISINSYKRVGRVVTLVCKEDKNEVLKKLQDMNPLIIDELEMNFEEAFLQELASGKEKK